MLKSKEKKRHYNTTKNIIIVKHGKLFFRKINWEYGKKKRKKKSTN
jgi:hypothetical protein